MEISGRVKKISDTQTFASGFRKRELVLITEEQYPQHILVEFVQDKTELLDALMPDDQVKISINLRGREWVNPEGVTKYFNSIQGWRIEKVHNQTLHSSVSAPSVPPVSDSAVASSENEFDDLPF
ncbi:DUF3127 domain-containing protein [Bacteroidetes bacterium endosymbiont of Geopemphigus sp.]|uniref:DUF3127 domain-containing protein n=1 Tax=Bacteroidetes bacterium endosymbiont of Geopemphigus sp. TaxID=2047937 RepID=UPI000CD245BA|nr:DUF3127 domain-containing protein [Bacteroidetes bacterium endosymbiont of Geopemphigus sp.]